MIERPAVLITGAAKRLGAAIAEGFAEDGWHVIIHYGSSRNAAEALAARLPSAETVCADLSHPDAAKALVAELSDRLRDWRVLVNCAGVFDLDGADSLDQAIFDRAMLVNAATPTVMAQEFLAKAKASAGRRVIYVTDQKIANPNPDFFSYTMSKHAVAATIPMMAMAANDPRDRIYGLAPGAILASHDQQEIEIEKSHRMNLLKRKTGVNEIVRAALFLAEGWLESGETLYIDSGQHLLSQPRDVLFLARQ